MRELPNERVDICRQDFVGFTILFLLPYNINCSVATCVLNVCKHISYKHAQQTGKVSTPSLPTRTVLSDFTQKDKKEKAKRGEGFMSRLGKP